MPKTFTKEERLCSSKLISKLFTSGGSFFCYPFKVFMLELPFEVGCSPVQILISVPKRKHKRANKRNLVKRLSREAYRLNKDALVEAVSAASNRLVFAIVYTEAKILEYQLFETSLKNIISKLTHKITKQVKNVESNPSIV